jgi:hypothetical protein
LVTFDIYVQQRVAEKIQNLRRLQAQRNELNAKVDASFILYICVEIYLGANAER